jgi:hypothetical protein
MSRKAKRGYEEQGDSENNQIMRTEKTDYMKEGNW